MPTVGLTQTASWNVRRLVGKAQSASWNVAEPTQITFIDDDRCGPFDRVYADHLVEGNTRVYWELKPDFGGKRPYAFQLVVGESGNPLADDWVEVGPELTDTYTTVDTERRARGMQLTVHYRVRLTDANGFVYYSPPVSVLGNLSARDWLNAREMLRQQRLRLKAFAGVRGFLLKRKRAGTPCYLCIDPGSNTILDSDCQVCHGTRFVRGYFKAMPLVYADTEETPFSEARTVETGTAMPLLVQATFLGTPLLSTDDLWVDGDSDRRYSIRTVQVVVRVRSLPILSRVTMRQLDLDDAAYKIPLEGT